MPESPSSHATPPRAMIPALRHALRPLVKLMLGRGMTFAYASELLKSLFVEVTGRDFRIEGKVAERDFRIDGTVQTDSGVSLVSGVHRKEVNRLRGVLESGEETVPEVIS